MSAERYWQGVGRRKTACGGPGNRPRESLRRLALGSAVLQLIQGAIVRIVKGNGQFIVNGKDVRLTSLSPQLSCQVDPSVASRPLRTSTTTRTGG